MKKILYSLGEARSGLEYFGIISSGGDSSYLSDLLDKERKVHEELAIILDVQDTLLFPAKNDRFWEFFDSRSKNSLLILLHEKDEEIESTIRDKKEKSRITGPIFCEYKLRDGTELNESEILLILYFIYSIFAEPEYTDLHRYMRGILSLNIFLPDNLEKIPGKMQEAYDKCIEFDSYEQAQEFKFIAEDIDLSRFSIQDTVLHPFDIEIDDTEIILIEDSTIERIISPYFSANRLSDIYKNIREEKESKIGEILSFLSEVIPFKGAKRKLVDLTSKRKDLLNYIKKESIKLRDGRSKIQSLAQNAFNKVSQEIKKHRDEINLELEEYHLKIKYFFKFCSSHKHLLLFSFAASVVLFGGMWGYLEIDIKISVLSSLATFVTLLVVLWRIYRARKKKVITALCQESHERLVSSLDIEFKKIPSSLWEHELYLLNLKSAQIILEYLDSSLNVLKLISNNSPELFTESIFPTKNRLIKLVPSRKNIENISIDFDSDKAFLGFDNQNLYDLYLNKYLHCLKLIRIADLDSKSRNNINNLSRAPYSGLLWSDNSSFTTQPNRNPRRILFIPEGTTCGTLDDNIEVKRIPSHDNQIPGIMVMMSVFEAQEDI